MSVDRQALEDGATRYARYIIAKRDLLQTLFYASRNSGDEAWSRYRRLEGAEESGQMPTQAVSARLTDEHEAFERAAQDAAFSLMLIIDYTRREAFTPNEVEMEARGFGYTVPRATSDTSPNPPVELNRAIWALANQARHLHQVAETVRGGTTQRFQKRAQRQNRQAPWL